MFFRTEAFFPAALRQLFLLLNFELFTSEHAYFSRRGLQAPTVLDIFTPLYLNSSPDCSCGCNSLSCLQSKPWGLPWEEEGLMTKSCCSN